MAGGQPDGDVGNEIVPVSGGGALSAAESAKLQSLNAEMADTNGLNFPGHWRDHYWHSEEKQALQRELSARQSGVPTNETRETQGEVGTAADMAAAVATVRELYGGLEGMADADIEGAGRQAARIFGGLGDMLESFDGADIPNEAKAILFRHLARPVLPEETRMDPDTLLTRRLDRLHADLGEWSAPFLAWWQLQPEPERAAVLERWITPWD